MRFAISEPDPSPYDLDPLKEAEEARQRDYEALIQGLRIHQAREGWYAVLREVAEGYWNRSRSAIALDLIEHADEHGWPDTLRAVAAAMQLDERYKRELMDRR